MEPIHQDKRVSQGQNGDLYFSNVMLQDAQTDYSCNARFHFTHTIQQKNPYTLKVKTSKCHGHRSVWSLLGRVVLPDTLVLSLTAPRPAREKSGSPPVI